MEYKSKNVEDTFTLATKLAQIIPYGSIILLNGDLGAGKTTFVQGFGKALGIKTPITSPTFTILKKYAIDENHELVHVDAYRLENSVFMELEEEITPNNIVFIEWSNFLLNQEILHEFFAIDIHYLSKNQRKFVFRAQGEKYQKILNQVIECINCI